MVQRFTGRGHTVMAVTTTLRGDVRVIEVRRNPTGGTMTIVTLRGGRQVIEILAHGRDAIVAAATATQYLEVIHCHRRVPDVGTVTILADIGRADMVKALTGGRHAIVTVTTTLGFNILMIKVGRYPTGGTVTVVTLCCSG